MPGYHRAVLRGMQERAKTGYVAPFRLAGAHAQVGEIDLAFEWLERAYQQRDPGMVYLRVAVDPRMHSDPRFVDLVRRVGFPES